MNIELKPPLKWAGGKRWLVPYLLPIWKNHQNRRLVEPFCGGLGVTLGLMPERALLNDINPHLMNFYLWLTRGLRADFTNGDNDKETYHRRRNRFNELIQTGQSHGEESAQLFYYLNRTGYNGLCRFNSKGLFNVPFGSYDTINYMNSEDFSQYPLILSKWEMTTGDFQDVVLNPDDFVYADPPYDVEFTQYSKESFSWHDQRRLTKWLVKHPGPIIISNQATDRIIELYREFGFEIHVVEAPRRISCTGDRTPAQEVIALKNVEWVEVEHPTQLPLF